VSKSVAILGSTGSIGRRALDVLRALGPEWSVAGLSAGENWQELARQARAFRPPVVAVVAPEAYPPLKEALADLPIRVVAGQEGVLEVAGATGAQIVLCAIVGAASIEPAFAVVRAGKDLALASKEALVVGGQLLLAEAKRTGARILPVDSEHSAVFQAMQAGRESDVASIMLTASGGPFRRWSADDIRNATVEQALNHPTWSMGRKITIDSASMMNKGLEIIEAHYLFGLSADRIGVVIHPEAIVHSLVEFRDGSMIAQLSNPDMALPIQYALTWPQRTACIAPRLRLCEVAMLTFHEPDRAKFPALDLAYQAARLGGSAPAVLNAANEQAVGYFIEGRISFCQIVELTGTVLSGHRHQPEPTLPELFEIDAWARNEVTRCLNR